MEPESLEYLSQLEEGLRLLNQVWRLTVHKLKRVAFIMTVARVR